MSLIASTQPICKLSHTHTITTSRNTHIASNHAPTRSKWRPAEQAPASQWCFGAASERHPTFTGSGAACQCECICGQRTLSSSSNSGSNNSSSSSRSSDRSSGNRRSSNSNSRSGDSGCRSWWRWWWCWCRRWCRCWSRWSSCGWPPFVRDRHSRSGGGRRTWRRGSLRHHFLMQVATWCIPLLRFVRR